MPIHPIKAFTEHPQSVGESYLQHAGFALGFAASLFIAGLAALSHAILPFTFQKTASEIVARLYARTHNRGSH
ncbi:MAG: DUF6356 family protein [Pseudomonadota bacterium]